MNQHTSRIRSLHWIRYLAIPLLLIAVCGNKDRLFGQEPGEAGQGISKTAETSTPPRGIRLVIVIAGLAAWYGTQKLIGAKRPMPADQVAVAGELLTDQDGLLHLTAGINRYLNQNSKWANGLLFSSSLLIDALGIFLLAGGIFGPSIRPFLGLMLLMGLRQICQALTALPPPKGMIWRNPGFPSLLVTYGVANDLFFSGHTAAAVYGAVELARLGDSWLLAAAILLVLYEIGVVIVLRAHYTMDIFAGLVTALLIAGVASSIAPICDQGLVRIFGG